VSWYEAEHVDSYRDRWGPWGSEVPGLLLRKRRTANPWTVFRN